MSGYSAWLQSVTILAEQSSSQDGYALTNAPDFANSLPDFIAGAEMRIYKAMPWLGTRTQDSSTQFVAGVRALPLAGTNPIIICEGVAAITPVNTAPQDGFAWDFEKATLDFIDIAWPQQNLSMAPGSAPSRYWAYYDDQTIVIAPSMDAAYTAQISGIFQPTPLSATAYPDSYLTNKYPALFKAASMIEIAGFMRDYGAQMDDPQMALSWEREAQSLLQVAIVEEYRRRGEEVPKIPPDTKAA